MSDDTANLSHRVTTTSGAEIDVLTVTDLELLLGRQAQRLLRWILGTGTFLIAGATLAYASITHRLDNVEKRNATDSVLIGDIQVRGSEPVRNLTHDLNGLREEMADLKQVIRQLQMALDKRADAR